MTGRASRLSALAVALLVGTLAFALTWAAQQPPAQDAGNGFDPDPGIGGQGLDRVCDDLANAATALVADQWPGSEEEFYYDLQSDIFDCYDEVAAGTETLDGRSLASSEDVPGAESWTEQGFSVLIGVLSAATAWLTWDRTRREVPERRRSPMGARNAITRSAASRRSRRR
jgi:hypothetical protein